MGKLNVARNLFLEKEELTRQFEKFHRDEGFLRNLGIMTKNYGIIPVDNNDIGDNFKIVSDTATTFSLSSAVTTHKAMLEDGYVSLRSSEWDYTSPTDDTWRYISVGHDTTNLEKGTLSLASDGTVTGTGTEFTKVLRGITTNVPTKIRVFNADGVTEIGDYQIISVSSDTSCSIVGNTTTGVGFKYQVIGSFSPSETDIPDSDRDIYEYDYYDFNISTLSTIPTGYIPLARVKSDGAVATVEDLRIDVWSVKDNRSAVIDLDSLDGYGYGTVLSNYITIPAWGASFTCDLPNDAQVEGFRYIDGSSVDSGREFYITFGGLNSLTTAFFYIADDGAIRYEPRFVSGTYTNTLVGLGLPINSGIWYGFRSVASSNALSLITIHHNHLSVDNLYEFDLGSNRFENPNFDMFVREQDGKFKFWQVNGMKEITSTVNLLYYDSGFYYGEDLSYIIDQIDEDLTDFVADNTSAKFVMSVYSNDRGTGSGVNSNKRFVDLLITDSNYKTKYYYKGAYAITDVGGSLSVSRKSFVRVNNGAWQDWTQFESADLSLGFSPYSGANGSPLAYKVNGDLVTFSGWLAYDNSVGSTGEFINDLSLFAGSGLNYDGLESKHGVNYNICFNEDGGQFTLKTIFDGEGMQILGLSANENIYINFTYRRAKSY